MSVLPNPPRNPRLRACLSLWWPFGLVVAALWLALTVIALVLLAQDGFRLPTRDMQLDGSSVTLPDAAEITAIDDAGAHLGSRALQAVSYRATVDGDLYRGTSFAWSGGFRVGGRAGLQMLPGDHRVQRLDGGVLALSSTWMPWFAGWIWLPLCAVLGFWLVRVYRLRVMLRQGPEAAAELLEAAPRRYVNPPQLLVRYRFTAGGNPVEGWRWLRLDSPLARRLQQLPLPAAAADVAVVYEELAPAHHRLLAREHFEPA